MAKQLVFLPPNLQHQDQRRKELCDAIRRAHAAKISYRTRQQKLNGQDATVLDKETFCDDGGTNFVTTEDEIGSKSSHSITKHEYIFLPHDGPVTRKKSQRETRTCKGRHKRIPPEQDVDGETRPDRVAGIVAQVGTGRTDPFNVLHIPGENPRDMELVDHIAERLWPGFRHTFDGKYNPFPAYWLPRGVNNPALHHALLFASSCHLASRMSLAGLEPHVEFELLSHQTKAIKSLRQQVDRDRQVISDADMEDLIMTTVCLATNSQNGQIRISRDPSPFYPLLTSGHWLDTYGALASTNMHWNAVSSLIESYGGIHKVKSFGLAWVISCAALDAIAGTLSRPVYPLLNPRGQPCKLKSIAEFQLQDVWEDAYHGAGDGFRVLESFGVQTSVVDVFVSLGDISATLDAYATGKILNPVTDEILESREMIMHALLSLPEGVAAFSPIEQPAAADPRGDSQFPLHFYELCRWTSLLYGIMVVFPIPRSKWAREYSISRIRGELTNLGTRPDETRIAKTLMWCAMVAGTLTYVKEERAWFRNRVQAEQEVLEIKTWEDAEKLLLEFGWVANICNAAASTFWRELPD